MIWGCHHFRKHPYCHINEQPLPISSKTNFLPHRCSSFRFRVFVRCQVTGYSPRPATSPATLAAEPKRWFPANPLNNSPLASRKLCFIHGGQAVFHWPWIQVKKPFPTFFPKQLGKRMTNIFWSQKCPTTSRWWFQPWLKDVFSSNWIISLRDRGKNSIYLKHFETTT